ncbi:MAG: HEAT repeat domain-containing protein [Candidatus Sericytochromatia bacterium]|uniref:HEAT repeat domain-containing protein n=1 Tax=Candidatus Tanganyikabacteria bacterium TaxID=2961651 RepID=A0A937X577_9BACT|nr:HEAT repeat domain-containing protein [Candidatus Tanganyikabacteria bacterium]
MSDPLPGSFAASNKPPADIRQVLLDAMLDDTDEEFTNRVSGILEKSLMPEASLFLPFVDHEEEMVRRRSVFLLSQVGGNEAVKAITSRLHDGSAIVRSSAVSSLGRLQAKEAVEELCSLLQSGADVSLSKAVAEALGKIGDPSAIPALQTAGKALGIVVRTTCDMAVRKIQSAQRAASA